MIKIGHFIVRAKSRTVWQLCDSASRLVPTFAFGKVGTRSMSIIAVLLICLLPAFSHALCLKDCQPQAPISGRSFNYNSTPNSTNYTADDMQYREKSHDTGDLKNSVMGDVNIRVGHDQLDIKMDSKSHDNMVDASVSSTIILGDMKK